MEMIIHKRKTRTTTDPHGQEALGHVRILQQELNRTDSDVLVRSLVRDPRQLPLGNAGPRDRSAPFALRSRPQRAEVRGRAAHPRRPRRGWHARAAHDGVPRRMRPWARERRRLGRHELGEEVALPDRHNTCITTRRHPTALNSTREVPPVQLKPLTRAPVPPLQGRGRGSKPSAPTDRSMQVRVGGGYPGSAASVTGLIRSLRSPPGKGASDRETPFSSCSPRSSKSDPSHEEVTSRSERPAPPRARPRDYGRRNTSMAAAISSSPCSTAARPNCSRRKCGNFALIPFRSAVATRLSIADTWTSSVA